MPSRRIPARNDHTIYYYIYDSIYIHRNLSILCSNWKITREKGVYRRIGIMLLLRYAILTGLTNLLKSWQHNNIIVQVRRVSISDVREHSIFSFLFFHPRVYSGLCVYIAIVVDPVLYLYTHNMYIYTVIYIILFNVRVKSLFFSLLDTDAY